MRGHLQQWVSDHASETSDEWIKLTGLPSGWDVGERVPLFIALAAAGQPNVLKGGAFPISLPSAGLLSLVWIAPIRSRPKRTYDEPQTSYSPEGAHTPYIIKRMLNSGKDAEKFRHFMEGVGQASGLFQKIEIQSFGDSQTAPFEVDAYLDGKALRLDWVGYGVSQALPIFVELLHRSERSWFAIQQPEVHLHPRAQASLGDVFYEMATRDKKTFMVETHSDFLIDRFRLNYRRKSVHAKKPAGQILFFERKNSQNTVTPLQFGQGGELPEIQPDGYRDFFIKEQMQLLGL